MMKGQLAGLMKQAQQMQDNLKRVQEQLAEVEVEGQAGAGLVKGWSTAAMKCGDSPLIPACLPTIATCSRIWWWPR